MKLLSLSVLLIGLSSSLPAFAQFDESKIQHHLDEIVDRSLEEKRIVGAVVLVAKDGNIIYHRAAGLADRESNRPMQENTVFRLSSLTKPIVSAAALSLIEKGLLNLDDPVTKFIPNFKPQLTDGITPVITIRHLLTHTAGLSYGFFEPSNGPYRTAGISDGLDRVEFSLMENLLKITTVPLLYPPGVAWLYSVATDVLGEVLTRAGGASLPEIVKSLVTDPLKMNETSFTVQDASQLATAYVASAPAPALMTDGMIVPFFGPGTIIFSPSRIFDENAFHSAGSGMAGTALDYMKFLEELRLNKGNILKKETVKAFITNQTGDIPLPIAPGCGWSYGFLVVKDPAIAGTHSSAGTFQWSGVYGHNFLVDPTQKLTVVVMTNTAMEGNLGKFATDIQAAVYGK